MRWLIYFCPDVLTLRYFRCATFALWATFGLTAYFRLSALERLLSALARLLWTFGLTAYFGLYTLWVNLRHGRSGYVAGLFVWH